MGKILNYINSGTYIDSEKQLTPFNKKQLTNYEIENANLGLTLTEKEQIKQYLNEIIKLARKNRQDVEDMVSNLQLSENTLKEQIDKFKSNDIMKELGETKVNRAIYSISNVQYTDYYAFVNEYKYRLSIVSYKKLFLKKQLKDLDMKIQTVENYINSFKGEMNGKFNKI